MAGRPTPQGRATELAPGRAPLDIKILGPLRVTVGGMAVQPPDVASWRLLALFVVHADHVVPTHVMTEELWPDGPPPGAESELHRRISDLRDRLARADESVPRHDGPVSSRGATGTRLTAAPGGYRLDCAHATVDVRQFWRDSGAGFRALAADDVGTAAHRLGSALRLWTGDALANVPLGPRLRREAAQLAAARARAAEQWWEAEQRLGRREQAAELVGATAQASGREGFSTAASPAGPHHGALGAEAVEMFEWVRNTRHLPWWGTPDGPSRAPLAAAGAREEWRLTTR
ncbi:BTAD domain-containing putative transcriptional regulator [Streptomyces sp. NPDC006997]|uniref:AfsR/SARP family transcriptional regulator n=1 Tax=Streptomyces sp. NPDC006997 TaxID=3155356 RepID=UPI0033C387D7